MNEILSELNCEVGVKGSMVVTQDGIVVSSELGPGLSADVVAAVASGAIQTINQNLNKLGQPNLSKFVLEAGFGKIVFIDIGIAYLVVLLDQRINMDVTLIAISAAAYRIRQMGQIRA
jgi:predicted regulator of Ras-like GTPase activity (Roadblock/LC7/MglB family)